MGAFYDDDGGTDQGAVWILFLKPDGTVKSHQKISATEGGFAGPLSPNDHFGTSVVSLGDLDGDGIGDLGVGAHEDDDGGSNKGAVWILFLKSDGTVKSHQKISSTDGGFLGGLDNGDDFGVGVACLGDVDGDSINDLAVGARWDDDAEEGLGSNHGAIWVLFLETNGTVKSYQKISETQGGFSGDLDSSDEFGYSVAATGDFNGDGCDDIVVGAPRDDDGGSGKGAVWILFLDGGVQITGISGKLAFEDTDVVISGSGFDASTSVFLDGVLEPLVSVTPTAITIQPGAGDPGFSDVLLTDGCGDKLVPNGLRNWPTLSATTTGVGGTIDVVIDNGSVGVYALLGGTMQLATPITLANPPTWYGLFVDPFAFFQVMEVGAFSTADPITVTYPVNDNPSFAGVNVYLQSWCQQGFFVPFGPDPTYSFSNVATVTL